MATRNSAKAVIAITDPNRIAKPESEPDPAREEESAHPSSTAAPVQAVKPRPTRTSDTISSWTTLDIGGMHVKNVSTSLFNLIHLTTLFLNHNHLTTIPPQIERLRNLILLDLSGNQLMSVPPELGMLTSLRELYLFDNHITDLPYELGTLHQLTLLGVEGNPLTNELRSIVQKDGTTALVAYLREACPTPAPPPERLWNSLLSDAERKLHENNPNTESFSILCYNILCEKYATPYMYGYTPSWALSWDYRKERILTEITSYDADFLCLQEVDVTQYEDYFMQHLANQGYEGIHWPKSRARTMSESQRRAVDGCAIFFKSYKYQLVEKQLIEFSQLALQRPDFKKTDDMFNRVLTKDSIAVVTLLEHRDSGSRLIVANAHIHWDPEFRDVKLVQTGLLMGELEKIAHQFAKLPPKPPPPASEQQDGDLPSSRSPVPPPIYTDGTKIPMVLCGDFNSVPDSGVYSFLANGNVPSDHPDFMSHIYGKFTSDGLKHSMNLKSAYAGVGELPLTNYTPSFQGVIDYIWYTTNSLNVTALLGEVDQSYLSKVVGFPNAHFPSDHICILSEFKVKLPKDPRDKPPPPTFRKANN